MIKENGFLASPPVTAIWSTHADKENGYFPPHHQLQRYEVRMQIRKMVIFRLTTNYSDMKYASR